MPAIINTAQVPSLTIGGRVLTDLANLKCLVGYASNGKQCTFRSSDVVDTTAYQVPTGKTFKIVAMRVHCNLAAAVGSSMGAIFYCDNDLGQDSLTAATNVKYRGGASTLGQLIHGFNSITNVLESTFKYDVPADKYVSFVNVTAGATLFIEVYGYEV